MDWLQWYSEIVFKDFAHDFAQKNSWKQIYVQSLIYAYRVLLMLCLSRNILHQYHYKHREFLYVFYS